MLLILTKQLRILHFPFSILHYQWFIQPLPDIAGRTAVESGLTLIPYIYIGKVTFPDFQRTLLDGQFTDAAFTQSDAGFR